VTTPPIDPVATAAMPAAPPPNLDRALLRGLAWVGSMKWAAQIASSAATVLVARLLTPEDFGLVAMSSVYMGVVALLSEFGVGTSVIVLRNLTHRQISQIGGFSVLLGFASFLLSLAAAPLLGAFFRSPQLPAVVMVGSLSFIVTGIRVVPQSLLKKELRFRALAVIEGSRAVIQAGVMVALALLGFGYWTLVLGGLFASFCATAMVLVLRRHPVAWPRVSAVREAMRVGLDVLGSRLAWYGYSNADFLIAGRMLGKGPLGGYTIAWQVASAPVAKVSNLVLQVTPSIFAAVQSDKAAIRRYLLRLTEGIALITFPAAVGLSVIADDFVRVVLTDKYEAAILPLRILAIYTTVRAVSPLYPPLLTALGRTRDVLRNNVLALVLLPTAFWFGSRWGTAGIAAAWMVVHPIVVLQILVCVFRATELKPATYLRALTPAAVSSVIMVAVVLALRFLLPSDISPTWRFAAEVPVGAGTYAAVMFGLYRERLQAFRTTINLARKAKKS
jgi:PST family polysaccharide transporter